MLDPIYENLPDDPELTFLTLEHQFRTQCGEEEFQAKDHEVNGYVPIDVYLRYVRRTVSAAIELKLNIFDDYEIKSAQYFALSDYQDFCGQVDYYRTAIQIRHARRNAGYSVALDSKARRVVNHHLAQLRDIIQKLEIDQGNKENLLACLNKLQAEFDKDRTGYAAFGALVIEVAGYLGEAGVKLEPIRKIIDSIAGLIHGSKQAENQRLPPPAERKRIEPPKTEKKHSSMDDEIPF